MVKRNCWRIFWYATLPLLLTLLLFNLWTEVKWWAIEWTPLSQRIVTRRIILYLTHSFVFWPLQQQNKLFGIFVSNKLSMYIWWGSTHAHTTGKCPWKWSEKLLEFVCLIKTLSVTGHIVNQTVTFVPFRLNFDITHYTVAWANVLKQWGTPHTSTLELHSCC